MSFSFPYEAKKRIADKGVAEISAFLEEVPLVARRRVFVTLPAIDGFRKNTDIECRKKGERLVTALTHVPDLKSRVSSKEWRAFEALWCAWGQKTFGKAFPPTAIDYEAAGEEEALSFLRDLVSRKADGCAREDVDRLVQFGGFAVTSGVSAFVAALPTRETLERERSLSRLPADVKTLQKGIVDLERIAGDLGRQVRQVASDASNTATIARAASDASAEASRKLSEIEGRPPVATPADIEKLKSQVAGQAEQLERRLEEHLKASTASNETYDRETDRLKKAVTRLAAEVDEMRSSLALAQESYQRAVDESKIQLELISEQKIEAATYPEIDNRKAPSGLVKWTSQALTSKPEKLTGVNAIFEFVKGSFLAIGVRQTDADNVARTVVAGVLSGQMVQFRGSLAEFIAMASSRCLGGAHILSWQVPLGLCDGCDAASLIELLGTTSQHYPGVLLRGVNRSAFEIYGSAIRDLILESQFTRSGRLPLRSALFATWVDGAATLPGNTALLELGPIVDTDELMWSQSTNWDIRRCGEISFLQEEMLELIEGSKELVNEASRLVNALELPPNRLWQFAFYKYLGVLLALPDADYERDVATALAHWVIPWAHVNGLSRGHVERAIGEFASDQLETVSVKNALSELAGDTVL